MAGGRILKYCKTIFARLFCNIVIVYYFTGLSIGGVLAAHVYDFYGGVWLFRIYTCCSAVTCVLMIIYNFFDSL